ncbi:hypothetical protein [Aquimarina rubra]|uniref:Uncharacterized protein n=1 Tax=Aquimarina rubra TaxID=1920033 RepID=A0ABW5LH95_9FLAO
MTTKEKADYILEFFKNGEHQQIMKKFNYSPNFDIEVSDSKSNIDFSRSVKVDNYLEAQEIMEMILGTNKNPNKIKGDIQNRLDRKNLNHLTPFFLIFKGNRKVQ